jgi:uncharacterized membrane protein
MSISIALHVIAAIIWVGGMFFAHMILRPSAVQVLEPPLRLQLWVQVFKRFFFWVWLSIAVVLATGYWMVFGFYGGFANIGTHIHIMHGLGILVVLIFMHVFFAPYRKLRHAVVVEDYPEGANRLAQIRKLVGFNILLGLATAAVAVAGRYLA